MAENDLDVTGKRAAPGAEEITEPAGFLKRLSQLLKNPESFGILIAIALFFAFLWIGTEIFEKFETFRKALRGFLSSAFNPPAAGEIEFWFVLFAILIAGMAFVSLLYAMSTGLLTRSLRKNFRSLKRAHKDLQTEFKLVSADRNHLSGESSQLKDERDSLREAASATNQQMKSMQEALIDQRKNAESALKAETERANSHLSETVGATSAIANRLFPPKPGTRGKTIRSATITFHINKNFDGEVHRRYVIRAGNVPLHFWKCSLTASGNAQPASTFTDVGYQLIGRTAGKEVVYLPSENDGYSKTACIFFLPLVNPGEDREIEVVYRWPGLFLGMKKVGWEDFSFSFKSAETMETFELEVFLEEGSGGHLTLTEVGVPLPQKSIESAKNDRGRQGWRYAGKGLDPTLLADEIIARLEWRRS